MNSKKHTTLKNIKRHWNRITLKDKCLMVIMIVVISQSAYNLFSQGEPNQYTASIDVVIRTTSAAIFGYFLSANFLNKKGPKIRTKTEEEIKEEIDCIYRINTSIGETDKKMPNREEHDTYFVAQILIAAAIGIVSLVILMIARDIPDAPVSSVSALAQFRDFVSGCVGFLIGVPELRKH